MNGSLLFQALGISARRILDRLLEEHMSHGGKENGNLISTHRQLESWGVTRNDIGKGFRELEAAGFVVCTFESHKQSAGAAPSRYRLTWLSAKPGCDPSADSVPLWQKRQTELAKQGFDIKATRKWLAEQVSERCKVRKNKPNPLPSQIKTVTPTKNI